MWGLGFKGLKGLRALGGQVSRALGLSVRWGVSRDLGLGFGVVEGLGSRVSTVGFI